MKPKSTILVLSLLFSFLGLIAQESSFKIQGTIKDNANKPVTNAFVMIDNTSTGELTDAKGKFKLTVPASSSKIEIVSFNNGFIEEEINRRAYIDMNFKSPARTKSENIDIIPQEAELINSGYNMVSKRDNAYNIVKKDITNNKYAGYASISDILREFSGVQMHGSNVVIQGSMNISGFVYALVVVDGVYIDNVDLIKPSHVESIEVLKGASAWIYGSRGLGGAIIITTRKAK